MARQQAQREEELSQSQRHILALQVSYIDFYVLSSISFTILQYLMCFQFRRKLKNLNVKIVFTANRYLEVSFPVNVLLVMTKLAPVFFNIWLWEYPKLSTLPARIVTVDPENLTSWYHNDLWSTDTLKGWLYPTRTHLKSNFLKLNSCWITTNPTGFSVNPKIN